MKCRCKTRTHHTFSEPNGVHKEPMKFVTITMLDGSTKVFQIEEGQTVGDLMVIICSKIGKGTPDWLV